MTRRLPLGAWLALGVALAIVLPAAGAAGAWWVVRARQADDIQRRAAAAERIVAAAPSGKLAPEAVRALAALEVKFVLMPEKTPLPTTEPALRRLKNAKVAAADAAWAPTKDDLQRRVLQRIVPGATLFLRRPPLAPRIAAAGVVALVLLLATLALEYALLRRWVVRPLARLAADADQVAGGVIAVRPVRSRAREVAHVGAALNGMADGLRGALAERDAAEEQRRFLVTAIAHDLRTPLFTLRGSLEALEQGVGEADHLRRAQGKAEVLDGLVGDLFTFSRLDYAGADEAREPLDAVALAREAAQTVDARIVITAPARELTVAADRTSLLRILVNLLDNAVRHARSRVELAVAEDGGDLLFVITDDGPGIDADDLPHVFEPLFRADRARNSATGGSGLGLAIVERLAAGQGATVTAGAAPGGGARFTVRYEKIPG